MLEFCLDSLTGTSSLRFDECLAAILRERGGYAPGTAGEPTNHGITQAEYSLWREENFLPDKDVWQISFEEVEAIYQGGQWLPSHASDCPAPLDLAVFVCAVDLGPKNALRTLQQALGIRCDGAFGPVTRNAVHTCDGKRIALALLEIRRTQILEEDDSASRSEILEEKLANLEDLRRIVQEA
jgi:lysozyme family protein